MLQAGPLLQTIDDPAQLRQLRRDQLPQLAEELRHFLLDAVSRYGGHLGASLGTVELTLALHYSFNTPHDRLIWDVGHQAYGHKVLTGRRDSFHTNRQLDGISGFPVRHESPYDAFGTGHASTSIGATLGMALAARGIAPQRHHIALIGDGALTGGMAFEALNQAATEDVNLLVVVNDNAMSIDPNVGGLLRQLEQLRTGSHQGPNWFENLGLNYSGPIDGHNTDALLDAFANYRRVGGVAVLHVVTVKGKGYPQAESDQVRWHAPGLFDKLSGNLHPVKPAPGPKYQDVFGQTLLELAEIAPKLFAITPAMPSGSGLVAFMEKYPERSRDVGIAEQHAVTLAAGFAAEGWKPFCAIYSTFLQRAYDQLIHDVALQQLPVVFCIDRAGLVGADGATHHGAFDLAYLRCIPHMVVAAPRNERELRNMLYTALFHNGPMAIRYPRGNGNDPDWQQDFEQLALGRGVWLKEGEHTLVLSVGTMADTVQEALQGSPYAHADLRYVKPLDEELLQTARNFARVVVVEDGCISGGAGSAVGEWLLAHNYPGRFLSLGLPDRFVPHASTQELYQQLGLDVEGIRKSLEE